MRAFRILDAIGLPVTRTMEKKNRDIVFAKLVQPLSQDFSTSLDDESVDAAVSLALSPAVENPFDSIAALAIASTHLIRTGEFARLREIAFLIRQLIGQIEESQPMLMLCIESFCDVLEGQYAAAISRLNFGLRFSVSASFIPSIGPRTTNEMIAALVALEIRAWLQLSTSDFSKTRRFSVSSGDGFLLTLIDAIEPCLAAIRANDPETVISSHIPDTFNSTIRQFIVSSKISTLFPAQHFAFSEGLLSCPRAVVGMPTSSGKTFLAAVHTLIHLIANKHQRAVYLAPYRLLARQVERDFVDIFRGVGFSVRDLGSSFDIAIEDELFRDGLPDVAILTPERMDALLRLSDSDRRGSDTARELVSSLGHIVLDEAQLIGREGRGPRLELLITRLMRRKPEAQLLALTGASLGIEKFSEWLGAVPILYPGRRPTGLIEVLWRSDGMLVHRFFDRSYQVAFRDKPKIAIDASVTLALQLQSFLYPVFIVETKRQYAESVVLKIANSTPSEGVRWRNRLNASQRELLDMVSSQAASALGSANNLGTLISQGLAYHHAGVPTQLLRSIENLVQRKCLRFLAATTTVAEGAHLPVRAMIIPHLTFPNGSRITRELYQNVIGRCGRANVAIEGIVFILESDSSSGYVESSLWVTGYQDEIESQLSESIDADISLEQHKAERDIRGQIIGWLGDEGAYVENQAEALVSSTLLWESSTHRSRRSVVQYISSQLQELEDQGIAQAASPYKLTSLGQRIRLAGMSPESCLRIARRLEEWPIDTFVASFKALTELQRDNANIIAQLAFEAVEVLEGSLWFRRQRIGQNQQPRTIKELISGEMPWPYLDDTFQVDIALLSGWISGSSYPELGRVPPVFKGRSAFCSSNDALRTSDAADQIARISYAASWA